MTVQFEANGKVVAARKGDSILTGLQRNGLHIPTLCHLEGLLPSGACRMCVVEDSLTGNLLTACSGQLQAGMKLLTHSPKVLRARRMNVELLLAGHPDECLYCMRNTDCELRNLAANFNITEKRYDSIQPDERKDASSQSLWREPGKCILCGRCVRVCHEVQGIGAIDFDGRGTQMQVKPFRGKGINQSNCIECGQCTLVCPTAAITERPGIHRLNDLFRQPGKGVNLLCPSATIQAVAEIMGLRYNREAQNQLVSAFAKAGFREVFLLDPAYNLFIHQTVDTLQATLKHDPGHTLVGSFCPAVLRHFGSLASASWKPSTVSPPHFLMASLIKKHEKHSGQQNLLVSALPCTANSALHSSLTTDHHENLIDLQITARELAAWLKQSGIEVGKQEARPPEHVFGEASPSAMALPLPGGLTTGIIQAMSHAGTKDQSRTESLTNKNLSAWREISFQFGKQTLHFAIVHGMGALQAMNEAMQDGKKRYDFVEILACPGGCMGGGGQARTKWPTPWPERQKLYQSKASHSTLGPASHEASLQYAKSLLAESDGPKTETGQ